ncbi:hypothetical protein D3C85_643700 [compost metagenome]
MHGQAVLQAMHAAGVFRDVAADGTGDLRRRVGRVVQTMRRGGLGNRQVAHPRLDPCDAGGGVDVQDLVEARHHQQHAFFQRQGATGQSGSGTPGNHRHLTLMTQAQHALNLRDVPRQHHQHRRGAIRRQAIAFVRLEFFLLMQDFQLRHLRSQGLQQRVSVDVRQGAVNAFIVENVHWRSTLALLLCEVCFRDPLS